MTAWQAKDDIFWEERYKLCRNEKKEGSVFMCRFEEGETLTATYKRPLYTLISALRKLNVLLYPKLPYRTDCYDL